MTTSITSGRARRALKVGALTGQVGTSYLWQSLLKPFRSTDSHTRELLETRRIFAEEVAAAPVATAKPPRPAAAKRRRRT